MVIRIGTGKDSPWLSGRIFVLAFLALALLPFGCGGDSAQDSSRSSRIEGTEPGDCDDGADNDADGFVDCDDMSCIGSPLCAEVAEICFSVYCDDGNECTVDACDPADGECGYTNVTDGMACDFGGMPGLCGAGVCEDAMLCAGVDCDDGNECTVNICDPFDGTCGNNTVTNGTSCDFGGGEPGVCESSTCTKMRSWSTPQRIENNNGGLSHGPQIAVDPDGNALVVWSQSDNGMYGRYNIWSNRYTPVGGWRTAEVIDPNDANTGNAEQPAIAIDANGNALSVWRQRYRGAFQVWASQYTPAGGWGTASLIGPVAGDAGGTQVAMNSHGNGVAAWTQADENGRYSVWANRYTPSEGWSTAELIESDDRGNAGGVQVAIDADGDALAVWPQHSGPSASSPSYVWFNRYTASTGWATAALIAPDRDAVPVRMAMAPNGDAVAVWQRWNDGAADLWSSRYASSGGWGAPELIEFGDGQAEHAAVTMDSNGNVMAVWAQKGAVVHSIWANRYTPSGGWGAAELIETDDAGSALSPDVAIDRFGNALAVWNQGSSGRYNIWSNRYTMAGGWGTAELIESDDLGHGFAPQVTIDQSGNAVAAWMRSDEVLYNIWANRFE
jgi:hypothetical protein